MKPSVSQFPLIAQVLDSSVDIIEIFDEAHQLVYVNSAFERATGYCLPQVVGKLREDFGTSEVHSADFYRQIERVLMNGRSWSGVLSIVTKDRRLLTSDVVISPVRDETGAIRNYVSIGRLLGEGPELRVKLAWSQELLLASQLALGVSHQVNNSLGYIFANVSYVREQIERSTATVGATEKSEIDTALRDIHDGAAHIRDTVRYLSVFANRDDNPRVTGVHDALEGAVDLLRGDIRERGRVVCSYRDVPDTWGKPSHLLQIFFNVILNASMSLKAENKEINEIHVATQAERGNIVVKITDNGVGLTEAELTQVFDPTFSLENTGGMGLRFAIARSLVEGLGGRLVVSRAEHGAAATITLLSASGSTR